MAVSRPAGPIRRRDVRPGLAHAGHPVQHDHSLAQAKAFDALAAPTGREPKRGDQVDPLVGPGDPVKQASDETRVIDVLAGSGGLIVRDGDRDCPAGR